MRLKEENIQIAMKHVSLVNGEYVFNAKSFVAEFGEVSERALTTYGRRATARFLRNEGQEGDLVVKEKEVIEPSELNLFLSKEHRVMIDGESKKIKMVRRGRSFVTWDVIN